MFYNSIVAAIPHTEPWGFNTVAVMISCNVVVAIGRFIYTNSASSPSLPVGELRLFRNFNLPELLATMSFGHILGVGMMLGLTNVGAI